MKLNLLYSLIGLTILQGLINGIVNVMTLIMAGIVLGVLAEKQKSHELSLWKLIMGNTIGAITLLLWVAKAFRFI